MPCRTSSWSSATRMRIFLECLVMGGYRYAHRCATTVSFNIKPSAVLLHSLGHARNPHSENCRDLARMCHFSSVNSTTVVPHFQRKYAGLRQQVNAGRLTSRVAMNIDEALLNHSKQ